MASKNNTPLHRRNFILDFAGTRRKLSHVSLMALFLAIGLLVTACGGSTPPPTATPAMAPVDSAPALDQLGEPPDQFLKFSQLTSDDGLSNDSVWGIAQDSQGFMWFATLDGLNRYDGNDFKL